MAAQLQPDSSSATDPSDAAAEYCITLTLVVSPRD
jgi:hypothetical protein